MCSGRGKPGNKTTDRGNNGNSFTPLTISLASLISRELKSVGPKSRFARTDDWDGTLRIIADAMREVSKEESFGVR